MVKADARPLSPGETALTAFIIAGSSFGDAFDDLSRFSVRAMNDGDMGSIEFAGESGRKMGGTVGVAEFKDADDMPVIASLLIDQYGALYQLDLWKVDCSPLIRIPDAQDFRPAT